MSLPAQYGYGAGRRLVQQRDVDRLRPLHRRFGGASAGLEPSSPPQAASSSAQISGAPHKTRFRIDIPPRDGPARSRAASQKAAICDRRSHNAQRGGVSPGGAYEHTCPVRTEAARCAPSAVWCRSRALIAVRIAFVTLTRARSAGDAGRRSRPPRPAARTSSCVSASISRSIRATRSGSHQSRACARSSPSSSSWRRYASSARASSSRRTPLLAGRASRRGPAPQRPRRARARAPHGRVPRAGMRCTEAP